MSDLSELRHACTERQARFAEEYVRNGGNATDAARAAGYSGGENALARRGHENARNRKVRVYIDALTARARPNVERDVQAILERLTLIGMGRECVTIVTKEGESIDAPALPRDQVEALKTLAKIHGLLDPKLKVELEASLVGQLERLRQHMPAEAFRALLEALRKLGGAAA